MDHHTPVLSEPFDFGAYLNLSSYDEEDLGGAGHLDYPPSPSPLHAASASPFHATSAEPRLEPHLGASGSTTVNEHVAGNQGIKDILSCNHQNATSLEGGVMLNRPDAAIELSTDLSDGSNGVMQQMLAPGLGKARDRVDSDLHYCTWLPPNKSCKQACLIDNISGRFGGFWKGYSCNHTQIRLCHISGYCDSIALARSNKTEHMFAPTDRLGVKIQCRCVFEGCRYACARLTDMRRHHASKHCIAPTRYPCPEPFCPLGGNDGFKRLDKLKEHHNEVHEGKLRLTQGGRRIEPAIRKPTEL